MDVSGWVCFGYAFPCSTVVFILLDDVMYISWCNSVEVAKFDCLHVNVVSLGTSETAVWLVP
jgi:hypothetical protein